MCVLLFIAKNIIPVHCWKTPLPTESQWTQRLKHNGAHESMKTKAKLQMKMMIFLQR